jgi:hypothetical protein
MYFIFIIVNETSVVSGTGEQLEDKLKKLGKKKRSKKK